MLDNELDTDEVRPLLNDAGPFGGDFTKLLLDQYKIYVEMADQVSQRRANANMFLLTVNTALVTLYSLVPASHEKGLIGPWIYAIPAAGILISFAWFLQLRSYNNLNGAKFKVIHQLEAHLPARLFDVEWDKLGRGQTFAYLPLSHLEMAVPVVFAAIYAAAVVLHFLGI